MIKLETLSRTAGRNDVGIFYFVTFLVLLGIASMTIYLFFWDNEKNTFKF